MNIWERFCWPGMHCLRGRTSGAFVRITFLTAPGAEEQSLLIAGTDDSPEANDAS